MTFASSQAALDAAIQSYYADQVDEDARITTRSVGASPHLLAIARRG